MLLSVKSRQFVDYRVLACIVLTTSFACASDDQLMKETFNVHQLAPTGESGGELIDCICSSLAPSSWDKYGGDSTIKWRCGELIVSAPADVNGRIAKLLNVVGELPPAKSKESAATPKTLRIVVADETHDESGKRTRREVVVYPAGDLLHGPATWTNAQTQLIELIDHIEPRTWSGVGGPGSASALTSRGALVIEQTSRVHEQVEKLLAALRQGPNVEKGVIADKPPKATAIAAGSFKAGEQELLTVVYPIPDFAPDRRGLAGPDIYGDIVEPIVDSLSPSTWSNIGGDGDIMEYEPRSAIIVSNTKQVHAQVASLLAALRKIPRYSPTAMRTEPQQPGVVGTVNVGGQELKIVVYDVGRRVKNREGGLDFNPLIDRLLKIDPECWNDRNDKARGTVDVSFDRGALVVVNSAGIQAQVAKAIDEFVPEQR